MCCRRIFVVDDHPIILSGVGAMINSQEDLAIVGLAGNAEDALEGIGKALPEVVVVDISLPGANGVTLIERLGERFPEVSCIALTAHEDPGCLRQVLAAGGRGFVNQRDAEVVEVLGGSGIDQRLPRRRVHGEVGGRLRHRHRVRDRR